MNAVQEKGANLSLLTLRVGGEDRVLASHGQRRVSTALRDLGHTAVKFGGFGLLTWNHR
jgi:hypothetical protein